MNIPIEERLFSTWVINNTYNRLLGIKINDINWGRVITNSSTSYTIEFFCSVNEQKNAFINIVNVTIDLTTTGINGLAYSSTPLSGTINPTSESTNIVGTNTSFTTDLAAGDSFTCGSQTRTVNAISSDTLMFIDSPFTLLNNWILNGTTVISSTKFVYGTKSLYSANTTTFNDYATFNIGATTIFNPAIPWTVEFFVNLVDVGKNHSICYSTQSNAFRITTNRTNLVVSLGNGSTFVIANATTVAGQTLAINTWYHIAVTYSGTKYVVYVNGIAKLTINVATTVPASTFNSFRFGGDGAAVTGMAYYDLVRISSTIRYTSNFTPSTQPAALDASTITIDDFENSTATTSDATTNKQYNYYRGGIARQRVYYCYALNHATNPGYLVSTRTMQNLTDIPAGYSINNIKLVPMFFISTPDNTFNTIVKSNNVYRIYPVIPIIDSSNSTTLITHDLSNVIPINVQLVTLMVSHVHVGTIASTINLGMSASTLLSILPLNTTSINSITIIIPLDPDLTFCSQLSTISGTTTYSIDLLGFYYN